MSVSNVSSMMRITGMSSGLDVDSLVQQLMKAESSKLNKLKQQKQVGEWKRDQYRDIMTSLKGFSSDYFDVLKPSSNIRSTTAFSSFTTTYGSDTTSPYITATGSSTAKAGSYTIKDVVTATAASTASAASLSSGITGIDITGFNISAANNNNKINITLNGTTKEITLDDVSANIDTLVSNLQTKIDTAFGTIPNTLDPLNPLKKITVGHTGNQITLTTDQTNSMSVGAVTGNSGLDALGLSSVNKSNKIDISSNLFDIKDNFATALNVAGTPDDIQFSINGSTFKFSSKSTSLNTIITAVNSDTNANVTMKYDEVYDKITISSKQLGTTSQVTLSDTSGGLLTGALKLTASTAGRDASMTYNDGSGTGDQQIVRSSNSFSFNGISFELKKDTAGPISVNINGDSSKVVDMVKGFVSKYNDLIDKINTKLTETKNRDYLPLTDDQKSEMKDADITSWETKAKSGLLRSDSLLSSITDKMRTALSDNIYVDSTNLSSKIPLSLASIGITTSSDYTQRGKLIIDEEKLKAAITTNPDGVVQLFTKDDSGISYTDSLNDSAKRSERYKESGVAQRLYDILQDNIRTTRDSDGKKGILLEKAGMIGDISEFTCTMYKEIGEYDTRISEQIDLLNDKETRYYQKFSNLETMLSKMNSQGNWLSSQLGSK